MDQRNDTDASWAEENLPLPLNYEDAVRQRNGWCDTAAQHLRNEQFYRSIIVQIGEMFGDAAKTSDDGSVQEDVLALRVPTLVGSLVSSYDALVRAMRFYADLKRYRGPNQFLPDGRGDDYTPVNMPYLMDVTRDQGAVARAALAQAGTQ